MGHISQKPWWVAGLGKFCQLLTVSLGIHAGPKTGMAKNIELTIASKLDQWFPFQNATGVFRQILYEIAMEEEEAAIDPMVLDIWLFGKFQDVVVFDLYLTEARGRIHP